MPDTYRVDVDTTYLRFNPNSPKFYNEITAEIPAFAEYDEQKGPMRIRIFAWIVCLYDPLTPLRREVKDMYKRKVYAGNICGITIHKQTGKYREWVEDMFIGKDKTVNNLIVKFISSFASPEYTQLIAHVVMQETILNKIISGSATKDNQIMFDNSTDKIKSLTNIIYGTGERDEIIEARRALYKQVAYDLSDMRPESVARAFMDGGIPDGWNPYEEGHIPGDIHFVGDDPKIAEHDEE